jgi:hypothetical protein
VSGRWLIDAIVCACYVFETTNLLAELLSRYRQYTILFRDSLTADEEALPGLTAQEEVMASLPL